DVEKIPLPVLTWQFSQELPASFVSRGITFLELFPRPENGPLCPRVEAFGIEEGTLVVIPQQAELARHDAIDAFARVRSVPDDVSQTVDFRNVLLLDVRQNRIQRFQVTMYVANESFQGKRAFRKVNEREWA